METVDLIFSVIESIRNVETENRIINIEGENTFLASPIIDKNRIDIIISTCENVPDFWIEKNGAKLHETCGGYYVLIDGKYFFVSEY